MGAEKQTGQQCVAFGAERCAVLVLRAVRHDLSCTSEYFRRSDKNVRILLQLVDDFASLSLVAYTLFSALPFE